MANAFSKEERVAFEDILQGFEDQLVMSRNVGVYKPGGTEMERANNIIWRPMPYIAQSFSGTDMTANFKDFTQLSVPATLGFNKSVPWILTATELRDQMQEGRLGAAAKQKLASDINQALVSVVSMQGSLVVKKTTAAGTYDDVALASALLDDTGVVDFDRVLGISTRDYNGMAGNLASRVLDNSKSLTAYERSSIGNVAGFDAFKVDTPIRLAAAAGVTVTMNGANQYYTPKATSTAGTGETNNVDNRFQTISITVTSGTVKVGDAFTIALVNNVHMITKQDTGQLKTFRINRIVTGAGGTGTIEITPPIISAQGATDAELEYKNASATPASGAALVWLNTAAAYFNPFWYRDSIEIIPGAYAVPENAGVAVIKGSTDQGIQLVMQKWYDIKTMKTYFRVDTLFGVVNKATDMNGIILWSQT
jgi:hypothetical protein